MTFTNPLGLLALLAIPVVVALHLFRDRLPEKRVAGLFLFEVGAITSEGGRKPKRLYNSVSLWLECLIAALFALWLAGFTMGGSIPRHVVVVVDDSASMGAAATRERVGEELRGLGEGLASDDEVTVVQSGEPAQVVVGPRAGSEDLLSWAASWSPSMPAHPVQPALDLGRELAGHSGELVFLTDGRPVDACTDLRLVCCGVAMPNAALSFVQRVPDGDRDRLSVVVVGYGTVREGELRVTSGPDELARVPVRLPANGGEVQLKVVVPRSQESLRLELSDDALQLDNVSWAPVARGRIVSVCDQIAPTARDRLEIPRVLGALSGWRMEEDPAKAELILRSSPGEVSLGQIEMVLAPSGGESMAHQSPFILDRSSPLMAGVEMAGVQWLSGGVDLPGRVLVAAGDKVLISREDLTQGMRIWCDVDGAAGNLMRSPDWPILFANVLEVARRQIPGCSQDQLTTGDELTYRCRDPREPVEVRGPDGEVMAEGAGTVSVRVRRPGLYGVWHRPAGVAEKREAAEVAVRFQDASESDLRSRTSLEVAAQDVVHHAAVASANSDALRRLLVVGSLLLVLCNWWLLQRRGT